MRRSLASSSSKAARTVKETDAIKTPPVTRKQVGTEGGKKLCTAIFYVIFFYSFPISTLKFTLSAFVPAECNLVKVCVSRALVSEDDICLTHS